MTDIDIDAIRQQVERYTGFAGSSQSFLAHQLARQARSLLAKVDELTADSERLRAELADARNQAHRDATNHQQIVRAKNELANERDALKAGESIPDYKPCVSADCPACEPTEVTS